MPATKVKLARVSDGLYRTDNGSVHVMLDVRADREGKWLVRWTDGIGCRRQRRFASLDSIRVFLNS